MWDTQFVSRRSNAIKASAQPPAMIPMLAQDKTALLLVVSVAATPARKSSRYNSTAVKTLRSETTARINSASRWWNMVGLLCRIGKCCRHHTMGITCQLCVINWVGSY